VRRALALAVVALAVARPAPVAAHAPPSEATVDRYLKVTPMGDRIRLAYTIVFGQEPGRRVRPRLDRDRDRTVTDAEARPLGEDLARQVATALSLAVDDRTTPVTWARVEVGLGTPAVDAGALSVDLIAYLCVGPGRHRLRLRDDLSLPDLGSTELTLESAAGVEVVARSLGGAPLTEEVTTWTGRGGPLATGLDLTYQAGPDAARPRDGRCREGGGGERAARVWLFLGATAGGAAIAIAARWLLARRRRPGASARPRPPG
jgi:hypothetical protein